MFSDMILWLLIISTFERVFTFDEAVGFAYEGPITITDEARLHNDLFFNRTRTVFPLSKGRLDVKFGLTLLSVVDIDIANEAIVINANIRQDWNNPLVRWDKESYGNITRVNVNPGLTWTPDIYAYANIEEDKSYNGLLDTFKNFIIVMHDGNHSWQSPATFRMSCTMNVKDFPFDTQMCPLLFSSFTYNSKRLHLLPEKVDLKTYSESTEWNFISMTAEKIMTVYMASEIPYSEVQFTITMKRKPLYLLLNLVLPNLLLIFLTVVVFVIPVSNGERAGFVMTILLAITWFLMSSMTTMSSGSEGLPLFSWFLSSSLLALVFLVICLCYSTACYYADSRFIIVPLWIRHYIINKLTVFFGINTERVKPKWRLKLERLERLMANARRREDEVEEMKPGKLWTPGKSLTRSDLEHLLGKVGLEEVNDDVDVILEHLKDGDDSLWLQTEWQIVSTALDRLFLYIFTGVMLSSVFGCVVKIIHLP